MKLDIKQLASTIGRSYKLFYKNNKSEIFLVAGLGLGVATIVEVAKASTTVDEVTMKAEEDMAAVRRTPTDEEIYTEHDKKRDTFKVAGHTAVSLFKLYDKAIIFGGLSLACILTSHHELRVRNMALAASLSTVEQAFSDYRGRVRAKYGAEEEESLYYNYKEIEYEEEIDGKPVKKTKKVLGETNNPHTATFGEACRDPFHGTVGWTRDVDANYWFLRSQQNACQQILRAKGRLTENEVREMLNLPETAEGQIAGWVYDYKASDPTEAETTVDFGCFSPNGGLRGECYEPATGDIYLDFSRFGNFQSNILYSYK